MEKFFDLFEGGPACNKGFGTLKSHAFTLSEVLITLGIIGVVSTLTLPNLTSKYQENKIKTQTKHAYAVISNAYDMMVRDYGDPSSWGIANTWTGQLDEDGNVIVDYSGPELVTARMFEYIKGGRLCHAGEVCDERPRYTLSGMQTWSGGVPEEWNNHFYLNNGTLVGFGYYNADANYGDVQITLPGGKKSVLGKTIFYFHYTPEGIVPEGRKGYDPYSLAGFCDPTLTNNSNAGRGCTTWVVDHDTLDHTKCKLEWGVKNSCK